MPHAARLSGARHAVFPAPCVRAVVRTHDARAGPRGAGTVAHPRLAARRRTRSAGSATFTTLGQTPRLSSSTWVRPRHGPGAAGQRERRGVHLKARALHPLSILHGVRGVAGGLDRVFGSCCVWRRREEDLLGRAAVEERAARLPGHAHYGVRRGQRLGRQTGANKAPRSARRRTSRLGRAPVAARHWPQSRGALAPCRRRLCAGTRRSRAAELSSAAGPVHKCRR